jgi:multimeric flavodoxin WrbA
MSGKKLKALYLNCTLKRSPNMSHTDALLEKSRKLLEEQGIETEVLRPVDQEIAFGVQPDMTKEGWDRDDWPDIFAKVKAADILIITSPIWIGNMSSVATQTLERLYSQSGQTNDKGQYIYYNKVGGVLITGNEDGGKHVARDILYCLQHIGCTIPPQADAYWVGEAGPGPSYANENSGGPENEFTNRNVRIMSWNLIHFARMINHQGGIPVEGNTIED